ncbi:ComEC/Rec2 family competence protein [Aquibacillus rhizosphaerae]|uniref:Hydrolase n=1 Tax=Aquibacillus rhizosphaerae TaxID=3051431 RepID=A0ABT7L8C1_9BACI|nr:hypothetical protein [Aquibacillus sp. LR5S19]MDL4840831.1 hypothetical protein [Aquibacillus sp. LR5S19]
MEKTQTFFICMISALMTVMLISMETKPTKAESIKVLEDDELYVAFLNLPDGEATLIRTNNEKSYLINTGSERSEEELLFQLKELDIKQIDGLILTKQTKDYCGNAERLIDRYNIENTFHTGELSNLCNQQVSSKTKLIKWSSNTQEELSDQLIFKVLVADANGEMSLGITYGNNSIMYLSNSDVDSEQTILKHAFKPKILKVGDYGKGNSPSFAFLKEIDPHISIVFNSEGSVPNEGLIERLNESWVDVYRLKQVGTTIIKMDLKDYDILS